MIEALEKRIADLQTKLKARKNKPPYVDNVKAIESEIVRLEGLLAHHKTAAEK